MDNFAVTLFNSISNKFTSKAVKFFQYNFLFSKIYLIFCLLKVILNRIYLGITGEFKKQRADLVQILQQKYHILEVDCIEADLPSSTDLSNLNTLKNNSCEYIQMMFSGIIVVHCSQWADDCMKCSTFLSIGI